MTTATAQDRLRQIAILVSSVDASAARQILLHLPSDKARRVREMASQLGSVSPQEKRKILAEFQRSAAASALGQSKANNDSLASARPSRQAAGVPTPDRYAAAVDALAAQPAVASDQANSHADYRPSAYRASDLPSGAINQPSGAMDDSQMGWERSDAGPPYPISTAWMQLNSAALIRFVRQERPAVTAVVISQLAPHVAVEVLQHLPAEINREVLLRLSQLGDIDPEAMQAIDEHLSQRLGEYQHGLASELENSRRMQLLLAAAPAAIREQWSSILAADSDHQPEVNQSARQPASWGPHEESNFAQPAGQQGEVWTSQATQVEEVLEISSSIYTTVDTNGTLSSAQAFADSPLASQTLANETAANNVQANQADILPFPQKVVSGNTTEAIDSSLIQIEFEQILHLPPWMLANLLSQTDSQLVLLALAGATPQFMKRFMEMLDRQDAKALQSRLQRIGPIRLRDVDEAQRRIVENAVHMTKQEQRRLAA